MNEPHDPNPTVDVPSAAADSLDAGLAAGFGRAEPPPSTLSDPLPPPEQAGSLPVVPDYRKNGAILKYYLKNGAILKYYLDRFFKAFGIEEQAPGRRWFV